MHRVTRLWTALAALALAPACVVIEDGEVGVSKSFGRISDEALERGIALQFPVVRTVETWDVKLQELKETADVPSSEGLIVGLEASLLFRIEADKAPQLRKTVGSFPVLVDQLVIPYFRSQLRDAVSGYPVRSIYSQSGRQEIARKTGESMTAELGERGIVVRDVLLRDVRLPPRFKESIEAKLTAEQRVQQKEFELEQAKKDAEIEVARAKGAAEAQQIVRATLSDSYLHYLWIKTLNENPNVIYVATESNLPLFRSIGAGR